MKLKISIFAHCILIVDPIAEERPAMSVHIRFGVMMTHRRRTVIFNGQAHPLNGRASPNFPHL